MGKSIALSCALAAVIFIAGCSSRQWTEEQRKDFRTTCSQKESIGSLQVIFRGFDDKAFSSVEVKEYDNAKLIGTFRLQIPSSQDPRDREYKIIRATIDRNMSLKHAYEFIVPGQRPFRLSNMTMIMWPQYTMRSEGWGCVMGDYTIDGKRFEKSQSPEFVKR